LARAHGDSWGLAMDPSSAWAATPSTRANRRGRGRCWTRLRPLQAALATAGAPP
jgi:hypothetical protein